MKSSLNLMTDNAKRTAILRESGRIWSRVLGGSLLLLACVGAAEWWHGQSATRQLADLESHYAPVQTLKDDGARMRTEIALLRDAQQLTLRLVDTQPVVTLLGAISEAARQSSAEVYVHDIELERVANQSTDKGRVAMISGTGRSMTAIAQFASVLRSSELFQQVTLRSSGQSNPTSESSQSFQLECQL